MSFWNFLYQLTARDASFAMPQLQVLNVSDSGAKTPCQSILIDRVPFDNVFVCFSVSGAGTPAAATNLLELELSTFDPTPAGAGRAANFFLRDFKTPGPSVLSAASFPFAEFFLVPPGWRLQGSASFSAITGVNSCTFNVMGLYLPRGSFSIP